MMTWRRRARVDPKPAGLLARSGLAILLAASGCSTIDSAADTVTGASRPSNGQPGFISGFLGGVVADEPQAALVARDVLSAGGTAADAAVALGFALAVTLPSRAGLGGGGACLVYGAGGAGPGKGTPEAVMFVPPAPAHPGAADRPAAVPMLARGLFALHARYGNRQFESLLGPAEQLARYGVPASRAFVRDLSVVAGPLSADPGARAVFFPGGRPVAEGAQLVQPGLGGMLAQLRVTGVGNLYQGSLAHVLVDAGRDAGAGLALDDLRTAIPKVVPPLTLDLGGTTVAFLPPPADGGLAAEAAFQVLRHSPAALPAAGERALAAAARWRQGGADATAILATATLPSGTLPALPASTTFATLDRKGNAVVCALTMNNLFGTGRVAAGTGMLLAASPAAQPPALLAAAIAYAPRQGAFRAAVGGSGQAGAPLATAAALAEALADTGATAHPMPVPVPDPGRANVIECVQGLPGDSARCGWAADPRGAGLALGGGN
jgi:gamma-glutamyltranspeptidase/glutathione hydrolase